MQFSVLTVWGHTEQKQAEISANMYEGIRIQGVGEIKQMVKLALGIRPLQCVPLHSAQMPDRKNRNGSGRTRASPVLYSFHSCSSLEIEKFRKQTFLPPLLTFGCVSFHFSKIIWHILPEDLFFILKYE